MKAVDQALAEVFAAVEQAFEGDGAGVGTVVEEDGDAAAFVKANRVGMAWDRRWRRVFSSQGCRRHGALGTGSALRRTRAHWWGARMVNLMPSCAIRSSTLRLTAVSASHMPSGLRPKRMLEVGDAPANLGERVAAVGERHDDVVVDLGDGGAVAAVALRAGLVGVEDHAIGAGRVVLRAS